MFSAKHTREPNGNETNILLWFFMFSFPPGLKNITSQGGKVTAPPPRSPFIISSADAVQLLLLKYHLCDIPVTCSLLRWICIFSSADVKTLGKVFTTVPKLKLQYFFSYTNEAETLQGSAWKTSSLWKDKTPPGRSAVCCRSNPDTRWCTAAAVSSSFCRFLLLVIWIWTAETFIWVFFSMTLRKWIFKIKINVL